MKKTEKILSQNKLFQKKLGLLNESFCDFNLGLSFSYTGIQKQLFLGVFAVDFFVYVFSHVFENTAGLKTRHFWESVGKVEAPAYGVLELVIDWSNPVGKFKSVGFLYQSKQNILTI